MRAAACESAVQGRWAVREGYVNVGWRRPRSARPRRARSRPRSPARSRPAGSPAPGLLLRPRRQRRLQRVLAADRRGRRPERGGQRRRQRAAGALRPGAARGLRLRRLPDRRGGRRRAAVTGSQIFPNLPAGGRSKPVDVFYAASLGSPALKVADPGESSGRYTAIYTDALVDLLSGGDRELIHELFGEPAVGFVRPRPLRDRLPAGVLARLRDRGLDLERSQDLNANLTSDPDIWLARLEMSPAGRGGAAEAELATRGAAGADEELFEPEAVRGLPRAALGTVLAPGPRAPGPVLHTVESRRRSPPARHGTVSRTSFSRDDFAAAVARTAPTTWRPTAASSSGAPASTRLSRAGSRRSAWATGWSGSTTVALDAVRRTGRRPAPRLSARPEVTR